MQSNICVPDIVSPLIVLKLASIISIYVNIRTAASDEASRVMRLLLPAVSRGHGVQRPRHARRHLPQPCHGHSVGVNRKRGGVEAV